MAEFVKVNDKSVVEWTADASVAHLGWLVCLRLKKKIPKVHKATCSEIGNDVWSRYLTLDASLLTVSVECDMTKCNKATVSPVSAADKFVFYRTVNVCDAGWQASRSNTFDLQFFGAAPTKQATFEVLL